MKDRTRLIRVVSPILAALALSGLTQAQVDMRFMRQGIFVHDWKSIDAAKLRALKARGFDHIRIMPRAIPRYPGGGKAPIVTYSSSDLSSIARLIRAIKAEDMRLNISGDTWTNVHENSFERFERGAADFSFLVSQHVQLARVIADLDADRYVAMGPGNEWGILKSVTQKKGGTDAQQRQRALRWLYALYDQLIPRLWAIEPNLTLFLGGPSYKGLAGPGDWQDLDLSKWAAGRSPARRPYYALHDFAPDLVTRNGDRHSFRSEYKWPDAQGSWKTLARDSNLANYENGYVAWTKEAKLKQYRQVKEHFAAQGIQVILEEYGGIGRAKGTRAYQQWQRDIEWAADQAGFASRTLFEN